MKKWSFDLKNKNSHWQNMLQSIMLLTRNFPLIYSLTNKICS
jgi:hypothetical protein